MKKLTLFLLFICCGLSVSAKQIYATLDRRIVTWDVDGNTYR